MRFDVLGRGDASDLERLANAVDRITDELKKLDRQRANPKVDVDTRRAERQVGQFADNMQRRLRRAIESLPDIELDADASDADREIAQIRRELAELDDKRIGVDVDTAAARAKIVELGRRLKSLNDEDVNVELRADVAAAIAELRRANGEVDKLDGRTATVKVKVDSRGIGSLRGLLKGLTGQKGFASFATSVMAVGAAAAAATASVGGLAAAAGSLGAAVVATGPILLAGAGMIGGVLATLKVGTQGLGMAFEALAEGDMKNWGKALANLSPEAAKFAIAIKGIWTELRQAKGAVQDNLFQGMSEAVSKLARVELPVLKQGMGAVATELNLAAKSVMDYVGSSEGIARQQSMWASTATVVQNLRPWLTNVTAAMFDIGEVGGRVLADITSGAGEAGAGFRKMVADARESGQLEQVMRRGVEVLRQIGSIAGNVGSILGSVFTAAETAGADFLSTLDRGTEALANFLRTGAGQTALVDFFREARATLDALGAGLAAAAQAAAAFVSAFSNTGGLAALGTALSAIMTAVAPLAATLGQLAGETLRLLAESATAVATALTPVIAGISAAVSALGPLAPAIVAAVLAFKGLSVAVTAITALGAALAGMVTKARGVQAATSTLGATIGQIEGKAAAGERSTSRLARAFSGLGTAIPIAGAALVGIIALYGQAASKADESAKAIINGSMSMQQAIQTEVGQLENRNAAYRAANIEGQEFASVTQNAGAASRGLQTEHSRLAESTTAVSQAVQEAYNKLSPYEKLQADVAMAERELNDALASNNMAAAAAATEKLSAAKAKLAAVDKTAADSAKTYEERLVESVDSMRNHIAASLQLEQSSARVTEAQKSANEALKQYGADSSQYQAEVLNLAQAHLAQADAARQAGEQLGGASAGAAAWNTELMKIDRSTPAGAAAFAQIAQGMTDSERAAFSAAAAASGLRTEIITLPNGKQIRVVVDADRSQLDATKAAAEELARSKYTGTVTILGDPKPFQDGFLQAVRLADGTTAMLKLNADKTPAEITVQGVKYAIDATTGTLKVLSDVSPGKANLDGFKYTVDATTGEVKILAADGSARATATALKGAIDSSIGTINIDGDPTQVDGKTQYAVSNINGQTATITINGEPDPATGQVDATVTYANGQTAQITLNLNDQATPGIQAAAQPVTSQLTITVNDAAVTAAKANAAAPTASMHTINVTNNVPAAVSTNAAATASMHTINVTDLVTPAKAAAQQPTQSLHTLNCDDRAVLDAKSRAQQPTNSMHTINCNDSAVTAAKNRARQPTSSTHTIHVVVVGAAPPRAAGAYTTPRAEGAYAAPMAQGGMRRMSAARAEIVPPRQPRIIGDRMQGDEAFIPINDSARSRSILKTAANRMGYDLVPHGGVAPDAMLSSMRAAVSQRTAIRAGGDGGRVVAAIEALRRDLSTSPRQISNEITVNGAGASATAAAVAQKQRTLSALGLFG